MVNILICNVRGGGLDNKYSLGYVYGLNHKLVKLQEIHTCPNQTHSSPIGLVQGNFWQIVIRLFLIHWMVLHERPFDCHGFDFSNGLTWK